MRPLEHRDEDIGYAKSKARRSLVLEVQRSARRCKHKEMTEGSVRSAVCCGLDMCAPSVWIASRESVQSSRTSSEGNAGAGFGVTRSTSSIG